MTISYAITACNEHVELDRLLEQLTNSIRDEDQIVVQLDKIATVEVRSVCFDYGRKNLLVVEHPLNRDFASFKNNLSDNCSKDWIFQIDADEYPNPTLVEILPALLEENYTTEVFLVPRINTVEGLTEDYVKRWRWNLQNGRVNFPDYQWRIWKNTKKIRWINKVHERLDGFETYAALPAEDEFCLFHPKDIERQERQNNFYETL
jgi:glycosyltransferase involved in cell wall biosynthesis